VLIQAQNDWRNPSEKEMKLGQTISQMITHDGVLNLQAKNICQEESDKNIELSFLLNRKVLGTHHMN
jgi:hypothetical protein